MVEMRTTGLTANGPAAVGALIVGAPLRVEVMRTMKSLPWLTTQHGRWRREQAMSTGAEGNRRSVLSRICASSSPAGRSKLMPRFMLNVCAAISWSVAVSNTDNRLCTLTLKRSGGSGEAAELGTKPRPPKRAMLSSMLGKAPVGCAIRAVGAAVGKDRARRIAGGRVDEATAREVEARVGERRESDVADHGVGAGGDDVDHAFARVVEDALADDRLAVGAGWEARRRRRRCRRASPCSAG